MLEAVHLSRRYGDRVAVADVSLGVSPGRLTGFVGPNGAGKTTTLRMVMGITAPDAGDVRWNGRPAGRAERTRFGYLPEQRGLYVRMRVRDHLVHLARLRGLDARAARAAAARWLERLDLAARAGDRIQELSHGNQQRVQLAAALLHEPDVLLLDEPFTGLDPVGVAVLSEVLRERAGAGVAVLFSSHQLELVESLCDAVCIVDGGRTIASGTMEELVAGRPRRLVVELGGGGDGWAAALPGVTVLEASASRARLLLAGDVDPQDVLAAAMGAGEVHHFGTERATLAEVFLDAVAGSPAPARELEEVRL